MMQKRIIIILAALVLAPMLPAAAQEHDCVVRQFIMTNNVVNLEPQGVVEKAYRPGTERAYAFARLNCTQVGAGETFWFHWLYNDREVGKSKARVDVSPNWRIWSQSRIFPGDWTVQLKDGEGRLQAEQRFSMDKPDAE
ncbi:MAG TPA: DUF2914 domain-containing protein [Ferrovibrio sp.]|uniref:DUF2914 domain-containing protein n=1 Tax=Ferrovibrio sp. TaxID=1917215 RepID=UPI002ED63EE4